MLKLLSRIHEKIKRWKIIFEGQTKFNDHFHSGIAITMKQKLKAVLYSQNVVRTFKLVSGVK